MGSEILRVGIIAPVQRLNPYGTMDYVAGVVAGQLFQPPYGFVNAGSDIRPVVFDAPLQKLGEGRFTGRVRAGARFSDGSPITEGDVVASLNRAYGPDRGATIREVGGRIELSFPDKMADPHPTLVPTWCAISKQGRGEIGSGAYHLGADSTATEIRLVRNPHYSGQQGPGTIAEVHLHCYEPDETGSCAPLLAAIESGDIDFTQVISRDDAASLSRVRKLYQPGSSTAILFLNAERLTDVGVRRAIVSSIDRYALTRLCYSNPAGFVARGLLPPRMGSYADGVATRPVDAAQFAELDALKMLVIWGPRPYLSNPMKVADSIAQQLSGVGLRVEVEQSADADDYFSRIQRGDYDALLSGWIADSGDPGDFVTSLVHSECIPAPPEINPAAANLGRWRHPEADALVAEIRRGESEAMARLVRLVGEDAPMMPLMYGPSVTVMSRRVRAFEPHPLNIYPLFAELELE